MSVYAPAQAPLTWSDATQVLLMVRATRTMAGSPLARVAWSQRSQPASSSVRERSFRSDRPSSLGSHAWPIRSATASSYSDRRVYRERPSAQGTRT